MGDVPVREIQNITSKDLNTHLQHCRAKRDHNVAHKFFRRHIEGSNIDLLELAREIKINEMQHAWAGPEYWWWQALPGDDPDAVKFNYTWLDLLSSLDIKSKRVLFGENEDKVVIACLYMRLHGTYGHKRSHNARMW